MPHITTVVAVGVVICLAAGCTTKLTAVLVEAVKNLGVADVNITGSGGFLAGLVGLMMDMCQVIRCYSTSALTGNGSVGGLVGWNGASTLTDCFWDTQTSGQATSAGGTGKTTAEMQTASTFLEAGWDFVGEPVN